MICTCPPDPRITCPACDGTLAENLSEPGELGEACIAFEDIDTLCGHRAEPGSPYCLDHQILDVDAPVAVAA